MIRKFIQPSLIVFITILSLGIMPSTQPKIILGEVTKAQTEPHLIKIQQVNLEVEKNGEFVTLEELISDEPTTGQTTLTPKLVNNSKLRVNATYTTVIGNDESIVIHSFSVEVYEVLSGEADNLTTVAGLSFYESENPEELILPPNSSKSELLIIPKLGLPTYGNYKFAFRLQYHVLGGDTTARNAYFAQNMTFEFVAGLPEPPYILIVLFYGIFFAFSAFVLLGIYGNRKYKTLED